MNEELQEQLNELAMKKTKPFCYSCYREAPTGRCEICGSDDLMRSLAGVGVEYGTEWVIEHLISTELDPIDTEEFFEESIRDCYPETTQVGWMELDTITVMKESDPIAWQMAISEWIDSEESEGLIISFDNGSTYYWMSDVEDFLATS